MLTHEMNDEITRLKIKENKYQEIISVLRLTDLNELSPKQAFDRLWELVEVVKKNNIF